MNSPKDWCCLRNSEDVRIALKHRLKEYNRKNLCKEIGVDYMNFEHYLTGKTPKAITQYSLWRMCQKVGLKIEIKLTMV